MPADDLVEQGESLVAVPAERDDSRHVRRIVVHSVDPLMCILHLESAVFPVKKALDAASAPTVSHIGPVLVLLRRENGLSLDDASREVAALGQGSQGAGGCIEAVVIRILMLGGERFEEAHAQGGRPAVGIEYAHGEAGILQEAGILVDFDVRLLMVESHFLVAVDGHQEQAVVVAGIGVGHSTEEVHDIGSLLSWHTDGFGLPDRIDLDINAVHPEVFGIWGVVVLGKCRQCKGQAG